MLQAFVSASRTRIPLPKKEKSEGGCAFFVSNLIFVLFSDRTITIGIGSGVIGILGKIQMINPKCACVSHMTCCVVPKHWLILIQKNRGKLALLICFLRQIKKIQ